ncbi:MAG: peptidase inhibitor family I36 protein [Alphaproteobacteria bacterium]
MQQPNRPLTRLIAPLATLGLVAFALPGLSTPAVAQGSDVVCLYTDVNFRGQRVCVDDEIKRTRIRGGRDDRFSSFRISDGWGLRVCEDRNFGGWCRNFDSNIRRLRASDDAISSYEVFRILTRDPAPPPPPPPPPPPADGVVCLFEHPSYRGESICVNDETRIARLQPWDDNIVSSFKVNDGWQLTVCRDPNFGGWCRDFTASESNLRASNDAISSFQVKRVVVAPPRLRVACLFTESDFGGLAVCSEEAETISNLGPRLDDRISSVRLASGWSMVVCTDPNLLGRCARLDANTERFRPRFNDRISSYQVFETVTAPPPAPPPDDGGIITPGADGPVISLPGIIGAFAGEVCLFEHAGYRGSSVCSRAGTEQRNMGPGQTDRASSIRVPNGLLIYACDLPNFGGQCERYTSDIPFVGGGFNDRISSYRVAPNF